MKPTDTSEKGLESIIIASLVEEAGYVQGDSKDYDREHAVDLAKLLQFLSITQPDTLESLGIDQEGHKRTQFLHRLQGEIAKRGVVDVLRGGIKHGPATVDLFYGTPTPGNLKAAERFAANIFSVTRQLRYSRVESALALDMAVFINGLPIATFELKNKLTKQTVIDAVQQYQRDRDEKELLFQFGRCACILPWTTTRCTCVPTSRASTPGFCPSTRATTTARATRPILRALPPTIYGKKPLPRRD